MRTARRIVTAHCPDGVSRIAHFSAISSCRETGGGGRIEEAWATLSVDHAALTGNRPDASMPAFAPGPGGTSCRIVHIPPDTKRWADEAALRDVARAIGSDRPAHWLARHPGMHVTQTLDYAVVLRGQLTMVMEDGEVDLTEGDVIVQQATVHAWKNSGTEAAMLFVVMLGLRETDAKMLEEPRNG